MQCTANLSVSAMRSAVKVPDVRFQIGYVGIRDEDEQVWVGWYGYGRWHNLPARLTLRNHSPDGFDWHYCGSGPAQLALALLCHVTRNPDLTLSLYQRFKRQIVGRLHRRRWHLTSLFIMKWVRRQVEEDGERCETLPGGRMVVS